MAFELKYPLAMPRNGIDVSKYQGVVDWPAVHTAGYRFALVRLGWANGDGSVVLDPYATKNIEGAQAAGLDVGVYLYSYINSVDHARMAAARTLELLQDYRLTMPVVLDYEHGSLYAGYGRALNTAICNAYLRTIAAAGLLPMYYSYTSFCNSYINMAELEHYEGLWIANYTGKIGVDGAAIWQYSSKGSVPGIAGRVDLNRMYCDLPRIIDEGYTTGRVCDWDKLTGKVLEVFGTRRCEWFASPDIDDVGGVLEVGERYPVLTLAAGLVDGYQMATVQLGAAVVYVAVLDDRCRIVEAPTEKPPLTEYEYDYTIKTGSMSAGDRKTVAALLEQLGIEYAVDKTAKGD